MTLLFYKWEGIGHGNCITWSSQEVESGSPEPIWGKLHGQVSSDGICLITVLLGIPIIVEFSRFWNLFYSSIITNPKFWTVNCLSFLHLCPKLLKNILMTKEFAFCEFPLLVNKGSKNHLKSIPSISIQWMVSGYLIIWLWYHMRVT